MWDSERLDDPPSMWTTRDNGWIYGPSRKMPLWPWWPPVSSRFFGAAPGVGKTYTTLGETARTEQR
jgi:hypothetical protein